VLLVTARGTHRRGHGYARAFLADESGATAIEYGLIASGIGVAIIAVLKGTGTNLKATFGSVSTAVK
jgi:pilus assembly protein Flp/PilA